MKRLVLVALVTGCADQPVPIGAANVRHDGGGMVTANACMDAQFLSCSGVYGVFVAHGTEVEPMPYTGFLFPSNSATIAVGDPTQPFEISDGTGRAVMQLPEPFELAGTVPVVMHRGDSFTLSWDNNSTAPMRWDYDDSFEDSDGGSGGGGGGDGGPISGTSVTISADDLLDRFSGSPSAASYQIGLRVERVRQALLAGTFHADSGSAVEQRSVGFRLVP